MPNPPKCHIKRGEQQNHNNNRIKNPLELRLDGVPGGHCVPQTPSEFAGRGPPRPPAEVHEELRSSDSSSHVDFRPASNGTNPRPQNQWIQCRPVAKPGCKEIGFRQMSFKI